MYYLLEAILVIVVLFAIIKFKKKGRLQETIIREQDVPSISNDEAAQTLKRLKVCSAVFGIAIVFDILMLFITRVPISAAMIGVMFLKAALFWYGWNVEKSESNLKAAISSGRIAYIAFGVLCAVQVLLAIVSLQSMGAIILAGVAEMLLYTLLAWYYYRNAKLAGKARGILC